MSYFLTFVLGSVVGWACTRFWYQQTEPKPDWFEED